MPAEGNYSADASRGSAETGNVIGNPGGSIQDAMDAPRNRAASAYAAVQERSSQMLEGAQGYIQDRPFQAVIYAASVGAVIGFVAGMLLASERDSDRWYR